MAYHSSASPQVPRSRHHQALARRPSLSERYSSSALRIPERGGRQVSSVDALSLLPLSPLVLYQCRRCDARIETRAASLGNFRLPNGDRAQGHLKHQASLRTRHFPEVGLTFGPSHPPIVVGTSAVFPGAIEVDETYFTRKSATSTIARRSKRTDESLRHGIGGESGVPVLRAYCSHYSPLLSPLGATGSIQDWNHRRRDAKSIQAPTELD